MTAERVRQPFPGVPYIFQPHADFTATWPTNPRNYFDEPLHSITYTVNNYGFRGDDFRVERSGRTRVAFLGDSFCWGLGVRDEDHFIAALKRFFRKPARDREIECYNFRMPGFNTEHETALLQHLVIDFKPDIGVLWFFLNDISLRRELDTIRHIGGRKMVWERARQKLFLLDLSIAPLKGHIRSRTLVREYEKAYAKNSKNLTFFRQQLRRFSALCDENGIVPVLVVHPVLYKLGGRYPFLSAHERIMEIAKECGIYAVDLYPYFKGKKASRLWVHQTDQHPNERAHAIAVEACAPHLQRMIERLSK